MDACLDKRNLGLSKCAKLPQMPKCMITTPSDFVATPTEAIDPEFWQAALLAEKGLRIYLWPPFFDFKDNSEKAVYQTTPLGVQAVRDGRYDFEFDISQNLCLHKAMFTHRSISGRVFLVDVANNILGTADADGNFMGFSIDLLNTEKLMISNGTVATQSPIRLVLADNLELDQSGSLLAGGFVSALIRLMDVTITIVSAADDELVFTVTSTCDGTPISGLVKADFALLKADGTSQTAAVTGSVTEVDGTYTAVCTALVTGSISLVAAADVSIPGYESDSADFTVV